MFAKRCLISTLRNYKSHSILLKSCNLDDLFSYNRFPAFSHLNQRNTHFCSTVRGPTYYETENNFIFNVLNDSPTVDNVLGDQKQITDEATFTSYLNKDWRNSNASDILNAFKTVKPFCVNHDITFSDPRFDSLVDGLMDHCEKLTDTELLKLLKCISEYPPSAAYTSHNFHDMWSCLDDICCWKIGTWDIDTRFRFGDVWFKLKLGKVCDFIFEVLNRTVKKADSLTKDQLVHVFFYFNVCRRRPVDFEYEYALQHVISDMNIDEMAVVALGYFKTKSKIKIGSIMEAMVKEVTSKAMGIHEISLTAIMKVLRLSYPTKILPEVNKMLHSLYPELDRISDVACLHVALLATGLLTFHGDILRKCSQKLVENLHNTRLKDIERMLNVLTMFTFDPKTKPDIFEAAFEELHKDSRLSELNQYPMCLISALNYFSLKNMYSYELTDRLLDYEFIQIKFGKSAKTLPLQVFSLDACVDVDCPDYTGNRLPLDIKRKTAKWRTEWPPSYDQWKKLSQKDQLFLDIVDTLKKIIGSEELMLVRHILPHFVTADLIICKDSKTGTFIEPKGFENYVLGDIMRPLNDETLKWYAVVVLNWNNTLRDGSALLGHSAMKQRQLDKIGYHPITVIWNDFTKLSPEEKEKYILNQLI